MRHPASPRHTGRHVVHGIVPFFTARRLAAKLGTLFYVISTPTRFSRLGSSPSNRSGCSRSVTKRATASRAPNHGSNLSTISSRRTAQPAGSVRTVSVHVESLQAGSLQAGSLRAVAASALPTDGAMACCRWRRKAGSALTPSVSEISSSISRASCSVELEESGSSRGDVSHLSNQKFCHGVGSQGGSDVTEMSQPRTEGWTCGGWLRGRRAAWGGGWQGLNRVRVHGDQY